jgi:hypothetical protein
MMRPFCSATSASTQARRASALARRPAWLGKAVCTRPVPGVQVKGAPAVLAHEPPATTWIAPDAPPTALRHDLDGRWCGEHAVLEHTPLSHAQHVHGDCHFGGPSALRTHMRTVAFHLTQTWVSLNTMRDDDARKKRKKNMRPTPCLPSDTIVAYMSPFIAGTPPASSSGRGRGSTNTSMCCSSRIQFCVFSCACRRVGGGGGGLRLRTPLCRGEETSLTLGRARVGGGGGGGSCLRALPPFSPSGGSGGVFSFTIRVEWCRPWHLSP